MNAIFRRDLRSYLTSPLGYVYIAAFFLVTAVRFLTTNVVAGRSDLFHVFDYMASFLIFATPLLTMRLFSEEFKLKTDQLLFTSPVQVIHIVMGKFFAALTLFLFVMTLGLIFPLTVAQFGTVNVGGVFGHYVALIFAAAAFIAIGLFFSALTESQLISALTTLGFLLALLQLDQASRQWTSGFLRYVAAVVGHISIFRRYELFTRGLFSLASLVFYLSVCAFFLFLTARVIERKRYR
ncbi:MAG: ABC transporter [Oscillospiraceae bacterium]|nr:ABC transporter [Oscillospiraceae bacterium]